MTKDRDEPPECGDRWGEPVDVGAPDESQLPRIVGSRLDSRPVPEHFAAAAVLDKLNRGIVIFDGNRRVHFLNEAAHRQIRESTSFAVVEGLITFTEPEAQARLLTFLQRCDETSRAIVGTARASTVMRVTAGAGRAPFRVLLSSLGGSSVPSTGNNGNRHVLMIYEPHAGQVVSRRILAELYGLSEAEAEVALRLFSGETLDNVSEQLSISINTAKTHLQHIFVKCEVHSQGELLQLLSLGPRTL